MHLKLLILSLALAVPRAYAGNTGITGELGELAGETAGPMDEKSLSKFYDGFKTPRKSTGSVNGQTIEDISGDRPIAPAAPVPFPYNIMNASVPAGLDHTDGSGETAAKGGDGRALTDEEIAIVRKIYGDKIDYSKVRIVTGADMTAWGGALTRGTYGVTWGNTIYFPNTDKGDSLYSQGSDSDWLVHEMGHVYQNQKDGFGYFPTAMWEQLTQGKGAYQYQIEPGKEFGQYGIEQQATIIQNYYQGSISASSVPDVEKMLCGEGLLGETGRCG